MDSLVDSTRRSSSWGRRAGTCVHPHVIYAGGGGEDDRDRLQGKLLVQTRTQYLLVCTEETEEESNSVFDSSLFCFSHFWNQLCGNDPE